VVDWRERGTTEGIDQAIREALRLDGVHINSSRELAYQAAGRLWPGLSIHQTGLDAVQTRVRQIVVWSDVPDTQANHEACVRMSARAEQVLSEALQFYDGETPITVVQDTVASSIFTELEWPPNADAPEWVREVWKRIGFMVDQRLRAQGRLPGAANGEAAVRDDEPQPAPTAAAAPEASNSDPEPEPEPEPELEKTEAPADSDDAAEDEPKEAAEG